MNCYQKSVIHILTTELQLFTLTPLALLRAPMHSPNFFVENSLSFIFFSLNIVNNTICFIIVCPLWTDASIFSFVTSPPLLLKQAYMAIKALKQSVSISETQKMIHQWKAKGITDSATLKLLDLYLDWHPTWLPKEYIPCATSTKSASPWKPRIPPPCWKTSGSAAHSASSGTKTVPTCWILLPPVVRRTEKCLRANSRFCCRTYSSCCQSGNYSCKSSNYE